ncbi:S41 family peptidase [Salinarimonas ramus]|uniref:Peptidase S41 n=1 Tax=Salinarimonas ramus TaxID=690164 RepID=A0A917QHY3_9HYPH|nr:S41 family peptidase [Salinarimonas ramus]GGK52136.1 peptidase S41 [Salinarimonas ramus]
MRKLSLLMIGAAMGAGAATVASQPQLLTGTSAIAASAETYRQLSLFGDVFEKVRTDYVEAPEDAALIESAINGMLTSLDPHSSYLDPKSFRDMQVQTRGEFGGLGIEVTMEDGFVKVVTPIDETPAAQAGVLANDLITHIDGEEVQGLTLNQAVDRMRGPVNSAVELRIRRGEGAEPITVSITRDIIRIRPVRWRVEDDVGYVRITQFNEQTYPNLERALGELTDEIGEERLRGFVLDLRNNPGGLLDQAIDVSDAFLDRGEIVSTRGRNASETQRYTARSGDLTNGKPVVVLVNGGSASASEIVAGALQDHERATVLGTRSFGKGSVQTIIPLGGSGALRLTTARYYTPEGTSIQARGIEPNIVVLQNVPEELQGRDTVEGEAGLRGHLSNGEEERTASSAYVPPDPADDTQIAAALALLRGERVDSASRGAPQSETVPN